MYYKVEDQNPVSRIIHFEIPEADVVNEINEAFKDLQKKARVDGFRPGKAPRSVLEKIFKKSVQADVIPKIIQNSLLTAVQETKLPVLGTPVINPFDINQKGPFKFNVTIDIKPQLGTIEFKGLDLKKTKYQVTERVIEDQLKELQKNLIELKNIAEDRPARHGDFVLITYEGFKDKQPFKELAKTENYSLKIGSHTIAKEFDDQLSGMKPSEEKELKVNFANDHPNAKLAGLNITFKVILHAIQEQHVPEINDELAQKAGKYSTLEELKQAIISELRIGYETRAEQELVAQIHEQLLLKTPFVVPNIMIEYELELLIQDFKTKFASYGVTMAQLKQTDDMLKQNFRPLAEQNARQHTILEKVIEQENLKISDEEWDKAFADMAAAIQKNVGEIKKYYQQLNPDKLEFLRLLILEKKAVKHILENNTIQLVEEVATESQSNNTDAPVEALTQAPLAENGVLL